MKRPRRYDGAASYCEVGALGFGTRGEALETRPLLRGLLQLGCFELRGALTGLHAFLAVTARQLSAHPYVGCAVAARVARVLLAVELDRLAFGQAVVAAVSD